MRIAVANWSVRKVGGTESYLDEIMPELVSAGHDVGFLSEFDTPANRTRISLPPGVPLWCVTEIGAKAALATVRQWRPDLIYAHKLLDLDLQAQTLEIAPGVYFVHDYDGTCISGLKTFKFPVVRPCSRRFGWPCLIHYFPHRCGGKSPVTMWRLFRTQSRRLQMLRKYQALITHSDHMRGELLRYGFPPETVHKSSYLVEQWYPFAGASQESVTVRRNGDGTGGDAVELLFMGRMDRLKGGLILIEALVRIADSLSRRVHLTLAGDGTERPLWERRARRVAASDPRVSVEFKGWLEKAGMEGLLERSDLLVVPSLWPEPFGRVGPEAGLRSLPVAAFAVGGISEWLIDGVNGFTAPGDPPTADGLAQAAVKCLANPGMRERLRRGAFQTAQRFSLSNHMGQLIGLFEKVVGSNGAPQTGLAGEIRIEGSLSTNSVADPCLLNSR